MYRYAGYVLRIASHYDQNFKAVHSSYFQGMILYKQRMIGGCGMIKIRIPFEVGPYDAAQNINICLWDSCFLNVNGLFCFEGTPLHLGVCILQITI